MNVICWMIFFKKTGELYNHHRILCVILAVLFLQAKQSLPSSSDLVRGVWWLVGRT